MTDDPDHSREIRAGSHFSLCPHPSLSRPGRGGDTSSCVTCSDTTVLAEGAEAAVGDAFPILAVCCPNPSNLFSSYHSPCPGRAGQAAPSLTSPLFCTERERAGELLSLWAGCSSQRRSAPPCSAPRGPAPPVSACTA